MQRKWVSMRKRKLLLGTNETTSEAKRNRTRTENTNKTQVAGTLPHHISNVDQYTRKDFKRLKTRIILVNPIYSEGHRKNKTKHKKNQTAM